MPSRESNDHTLTSLELFAGPGGLALGAHQAGFQHLALVERERFAAHTLKDNATSSLHLDPDRVLHADAKDLDYSEFTGKVDLLAGGPPCQPFSTGGRARGPDDERNMFPLFLSIVPKVRPRAILIENVRGLTRARFRPYFEYILFRLRFPLFGPKDGEQWEAQFERLKKLRVSDFADDETYIVHYQIVNAADFGVPQVRERILIHAFRRDQGILPFLLPETHSKDALLWEEWVTRTYWEQHGVSPCMLPTKSDQQRIDRLRQRWGGLLTTSECHPWQTVRDAITDLPPPVGRGQTPTIANHVQHPGARSYVGHTGSVFDMPAKALKAGAHGTPGGENIVQIPGTDQVRYFTTREAARLQTFPDSWVFDGSWGACIQQLGNAVPVKLACQFASAIHQRLLDPRQVSNAVVEPVSSDVAAK